MMERDREAAIPLRGVPLLVPDRRPGWQSSIALHGARCPAMRREHPTTSIPQRKPLAKASRRLLDDVNAKIGRRHQARGRNQTSGIDLRVSGAPGEHKSHAQTHQECFSRRNRIPHCRTASSEGAPKVRILASSSPDPTVLTKSIHV
jgi:hypothetical protein